MFGADLEWNRVRLSLAEICSGVGLNKTGEMHTEEGVCDRCAPLTAQACQLHQPADNERSWTETKGKSHTYELRKVVHVSVLKRGR